MTKLAVFVEGQTEQIFVEHLLRELAGAKNIAIESVKAVGGGLSQPRVYTTIHASTIAGQRLFVMICDCSCDGRVVSDIRDRYSDLVARGYSKIIGLRDVYPLKIEQVGAIRTATAAVLPLNGPVPVDVVLSVMEVEAWFIAEDNHFARMDRRLTAAQVQLVLASRGEDMPFDTIPHPAETLHAIYASTGGSYRKNKRKVASLVEKLDLPRMYVEIAAKISGFGELCREFDAFLSN